MRFLFALIISFFFWGCSDIAQRFVEETVKERRKVDSISEYRRDHPISKEDYKIIERRKAGDDSIYVVRRFLLGGQKYCDLHYKNNLVDGEAKFYYKNGRISHIFDYVNDTLIAQRECYDQKGNKREEKFAVNGNGKIKIYHPTTFNLVTEYTIAGKLKHGKYQAWFENGNKQIEGFFSNDTVCDYYKTWYKSGEIESERKDNAVNKTNAYTSFYPNGKVKRIEQWRNGQPNSIREYDSDGRIIEQQSLNQNREIAGIKYFYGSKGQLLSKGNYCNGKKNGLYEYFHENGTRQAVEKYLADTLLFEKRWHDNGNPSLEGTYKGNLLHGTYKEYYVNGKLKLQQEYVLGQKHGKYLSYFDNGNLYNDGNFEKGKPKGDVKFYSRAGKYTSTKNYK